MRRRDRSDRLIWLGALILVVAAVVVVAVAINRGGSTPARPAHGIKQASTDHTTTASTDHTTTASTDHTTTASTDHTSTAATKRTSTLVRNATPQPNWKHYTGPVPILVYHALGPAPAGAPFPGLYVSYGDFKAEMAWLNSHGYQAVTLDEVMKAWYDRGTLPAKPIVITFDNGYPQQVRFAPHVMAKYGWPGVLNEITENHLPPSYIWPIIHRGWEVDSHSLTHPDLTTATPGELTAQVAQSRAYLRRTFHIPSNSFCYPSNRYNAAVIAAVKAAGYTNATTENAGYATSADPYLLDRFEIEAGVSELAGDLLSYQPAGYGRSS